jgi:putative flavoprotein involved in K+ transport
VNTVGIPSRIDTVVVGAGQAGLVMSRFLGRAGRDHIVIERRSTLGGGWQDRWDGFRLVTPNWTASLPGQPYDGPEPDGFMARDEIVRRVASYAYSIDAPVVLGTEVSRLATRADGGYVLATSGGTIRADRVIVATGAYHVPRIPAVAASLPSDITQLHSDTYRTEVSLPPGSVLVVGSGQSGVQIAEELAEAGRRVFLSVGGAPRIPRRYRGRDIFRWLADLAIRGPEVGVSLPTVDTLPDPSLRKAANPHLSGHGGGHETNLRQMAANGFTLVGRIEGVNGHTVRLAPDLARNLARADAYFGERMQLMIDQFITLAGIDAPPDDRVPFQFDPPELAELDLRAAGISVVIWATGYRLDYGWIDLPIFDEQGFPRHRRGVTDVPGLFFLGLLWQHTQASATLVGPTLDAPHLAVVMGLDAGDEVARPRVGASGMT